MSLILPEENTNKLYEKKLKNYPYHAPRQNIQCYMSLEGPALFWKKVKRSIQLLEIHYFNMFLRHSMVLMYTVPNFGVHKYFQAAVYPWYSVYLAVVPSMSQRLIAHQK